LAETQFKAGMLDAPKFQAARDNVELLEAEIAGDPVVVARVRLAAAQHQLQLAEALFKAGAMAAPDYQAAKNAVELREAELHAARVTRAAFPASEALAAKTAPRLQFRLVAGENDTAPFEEMPDPGDKTGKRTLRILKEVLLDESAVAAASATTDPRGRPQLSFSLTPAGAERFARITGSNIDRQLAIVFDGKVIAAPIIKSRISGVGEITGNFTEEEVARRVKALNRPVAGGQFRAK
jgi:preprotein translocase subunit SecD